MSTPLAYRFADLKLDFGQRRLERDGQPIELGRLTYLLLVALVESAPNVLTHDELVQRVWGGRATSPETVTQRVKLLRDALQDDSERPRYVALVRGQGYRLIPPVERLLESASSAPTDHANAANTRAPGVPESKRRRIVLVAASVLVLAAAAYLVVSRLAGTGEAPSAATGALDYEIALITTPGRAGTPAISPDGRYVIYPQHDDDRLISLWIQLIATGSKQKVLASDPAVFPFVPTVSPDGNFIDFIDIGTGTGPSGLWRVGLFGGTPHRLADSVSTPIGWSPDGESGAFVRYDANGNTSLVVRDPGGKEQVLAMRTVPAYFLSLNIVGGPPIRPSWSPDGRLIALFEFTDLLKPRVTFFDPVTKEEKASLDTQGSFVPNGIGWLGPSTLVLSQPEGLGQRVQLWRMSYPSGAITRLTNDLSSYRGIDLDSSRTRLVTQRLDRRTAVWIGDAAGANAKEVVPWTPYGGENVFMSWAGDRLLYDATFNGRPAIAEIAGAGASAGEVVPDAFHVAASPDGETIVFSSPVRGREGLWKVDASGRSRVRLVSGFAVEPVVTRDRSVAFASNRSGVVSPWIVPLEGGDPIEIVREPATTLDTSPDGRRLAFFSASAQAIVVCELPQCSNRLQLRPPRNYHDILRWTPDGKELGYVAWPPTDIWAIPLDGGAPHAVTTFGPDKSQIVRFAWSRDGTRLAFVREQVEESVVLLSLKH